MKKAVFIDKDGTLIPDIPYNVNPDLITLTETAIPALQKLQKENYLLIVISNQSGVARGYFAENQLQTVSEKLDQLLGNAGIQITGFYYCPHYINGTVEAYAVDCDCRKPKPGLILRAAKDYGVDLAKSWMIGDTCADAKAGKSAGCRTIIIDRKNEIEFADTDYVAHNLLEAAVIITDSR